jgi:16S rRNA (cytosine967-C5)-methyltransferase
MTPGARAQAAIDVLDRIMAGQAAEVALTNWGRASRFAGSGDRAAVRDIVYDVLRCRRSCAVRGGGEGGRGLVLGWARGQGLEAALFTGDGHAPAGPRMDETGAEPQGLAALDCPDWLAPRLEASLGEGFADVMAAMQRRAPVFLRVNLRKTTREAAQGLLAADGIDARPHPLAMAALEVTEGARRISAAAAYRDGLVELQDAASQAVVEMLPLADGMRVLDLCAGGGGKTLAMAARAKLRLWAHDSEPRRMTDLPARAARAGVAVNVTGNPEKTEPYDVILTDVPCSGSGSWRRDPQGKWALTEGRLGDLLTLQAGIMDRAAGLVAPGGVLGYATCSMLAEENGAQVQGFLQRHPAWRVEAERRFTPLDGGDGFFVAVLRRA